MIVESRVSKETVPGNLAGFMFRKLEEGDEVELRAMGPNPINRAIQAISIANTFYKKDNIPKVIVAIPRFEKTIEDMNDNMEKTLMVIHVMTIAQEK